MATAMVNALDRRFKFDNHSELKSCIKRHYNQREYKTARHSRDIIGPTLSEAIAKDFRLEKRTKEEIKSRVATIINQISSSRSTNPDILRFLEIESFKITLINDIIHILKEYCSN